MKSTIRWTRLTSVISFVLIIIVAHGFAPSDYVWWQRTISELAAQNLPLAWIMRAGFISFGIMLVAQVLWSFKHREVPIFVGTALIGYGLSMLATGVWSTVYPGLSGVVNEQAGQLHSFFATSAGVMLTLAIVCAIWLTPNSQLKSVHLLFLLAVIGFSVLFGLLPAYQGIFQRLLYLSGLTWLGFVFSCPQASLK